MLAGDLVEVNTMANASDDPFDSDTRHARDLEREPTYRYSRRPQPPLTPYGALRLTHESRGDASVALDILRRAGLL